MKAYKRRHLEGLRPSLQNGIVVECNGRYFAIEEGGMRELPSTLIGAWKRDEAVMDAGTHHTWEPL